MYVSYQEKYHPSALRYNPTMTISNQISTQLTIIEEQVVTTIALLDVGNTVPFIARYRKEVTGGLDEEQII